MTDHPAFLLGTFGPATGTGSAADAPQLQRLQALSLAELQRAAADAPGPFAVAVQLPDGTVFAAVDRFAVHSACYRLDGERLHVARRADALADASAPLDEQALFDYLYFHAIPSPRTVFRGVQRVPAGHMVVFAQGKLSVSPYWTPSFAPAQSASFGALKDEFRALLRNACEAQLRPGKAATFLSGGTDSSTVAGMLSEITGGRVASYSIGFEAEGYDEMAYARIAAKRYGTDHHEYYVTPDDLVRTIPQVAAHYDQPFGNSSAVPAFHCARMAHDDGVSHILAGDGGDELFGGNKRYATQKVFGVYDGLPGWARQGLRPLFLSGPADQLPLLRKGASYIRQASVPLPDRLQTYNLLTRLGMDSILEPGFRRRVDPDSPMQQQRGVWKASEGASLLDRQLAFDWRYTLAENDLPKVCGTTALAGLSVGFPLLDRRLVDFSMRLPGHYKLRGLRLRWFFKEALRGFLPDEIITKKKHGFGLPFGVWAVRHAGLSALAADSLNSLGTRGIVRPAFVTELLQRRLPEHPGYYGEMVWILMMMEQWLRQRAPNYKLAH
jgi:asparagine synthase (glutamine-hydrolysing)